MSTCWIKKAVIYDNHGCYHTLKNTLNIFSWNIASMLQAGPDSAWVLYLPETKHISWTSWRLVCGSRRQQIAAVCCRS